MTDSNDTTKVVGLVRANFSFLAPNAPRLAERFYETLFSSYPEVKPLFANTDMGQQRGHLTRALVLAIENLENPETLDPVLREMGKRHLGYGVKAEHYPMVAGSLIATLAELSGDQWSPELEEAWGTVLNGVASLMLEGAAS